MQLIYSLIRKKDRKNNEKMRVNPGLGLKKTDATMVSVLICPYMLTISMEKLLRKPNKLTRFVVKVLRLMHT